MNIRYGVAVAFIAVALAAAPAFAQKWRVYTDTRSVQTLLERGEDIWFGTSGALIRYQPQSGWKDFYDRANSALPHNSIAGFLDDGASGTWICTAGGLAHFDGASWNVLNTGNSGIPSDQVTCLARDPAGVLWIGTYYNGLARYDGTQWTTFNTDNSDLPDDNISGLAFGKDGHLWVATKGKGLIEYDGTAWDDYNDDNGVIASNYAAKVVVDTNGKIWAATTHGVAAYNGNAWWTYDNSNSAIPANQITSVAVDPQNNIWASTSSSGIAKFDGTKWTAYTTANDGVPDVTINDILVTRGGTIWLATSDGAYYRSATAWVKVPTATTPFIGNSVNAVTSDPRGRVWFGSRYFGVAMLDDDRWTMFTGEGDTLPSTSVRTLATDYGGRVWVGTPGGIAVYDNGAWSRYTAENSPISYPVNCISTDSSGTVWVATDGDGVKSFSDGEWKGYSQEVDKLPSNFINAVAVDPGKRVWIGTEQGAAVFENGAWTNYTTENSGLPDNSIRAIAVDRYGNVWFGTAAGVAGFRDGAWGLLDSAKAGLPSNDVHELVADRRGIVWAGTAAGIARLDSVTWRVYSMHNSNLPDDNITAMAVDRNNNLLLGMSEGGGAIFNENGISSGVERGFTGAAAGMSLATAPNPASGDLSVAFTLASAQPVRLTVSSLDGRTIATLEHRRFDAGAHRVMWSTTAVPSGTYVVRLAAGDEMMVARIVVAH